MSILGFLHGIDWDSERVKYVDIGDLATIVLRKHLRKRSVGVNEIIYCAKLADFGYTVARIVVAVFFNIDTLSALNCYSYELVLRVVSVGRGLGRFGFLDEISVEVVLVSVPTSYS